MAKNREASQFNSLVNVNDTTAQVGIANSVGINTTAPQGNYALYVQGDANITGTIIQMEILLHHWLTLQHLQSH